MLPICTNGLRLLVSSLFSKLAQVSIANSWPMISAKSTQKFGRAYYPFIEAVLQRLLPQNSNKKVEFHTSIEQFISANNENFYANNTR
jgi:hypothetical protein